MNIQIIDVSPKIDPQDKNEVVAWDVDVIFQPAPKSARPKTYRIMLAQMTILQDALKVSGPQDCVGKHFLVPTYHDDIRVCLESLLGPVGVTYGSVVPA